MSYIGKYVFTMPTPSGERETTFFLRNYYDGSLHGTVLSSHGGVTVASDIEAEGNEVAFTAQTGPAKIRFKFKVGDEGGFTGKAIVSQSDGSKIETDVTGKKGEISPQDDGDGKVKMKKKALILYATITKNTEKVAVWYRETFEHYGMATTMVRVTNTTDWSEYEGSLYFDDYDVVCMGSPIIGGSPMKCMLKHFSAGAVSTLEDRVAKNAEANLSFNTGGAGGFAEGDVKGGPGGPPPAGGPGAPPPDGPPPGLGVSVWRKPGAGGGMPYPGGPPAPGAYEPLGIVFTTYGGGFSGSKECLPVLELLTLYLESLGAKVIGKFACCGKEFGPAGLDDGETPMRIAEPPVYYRDSEGKYHAGSFFFHCHSSAKPGAREETKAKAFIADIVEDHFYTADGKRRRLDSEYISIS